jgi:hypothetical protein
MAARLLREPLVKWLAVIALLASVAAHAEAGAQLVGWAAHEGEAAGAQPAVLPVPPPPAAEQAAAPQKREEKQTITATTTPDQLASLSGINVNASFDTYLGQGTFYDASMYSYLASSLYLGARYLFALFGTKLAVSGSGSVAYEYTLPDSTTGRRWTWRDLGFSLSAPALLREKRLTGITMTPSLSVTVPITYESWASTTITVLGAGLSFSRSVGRFDFNASLSGSHHFVVSQVPSIPGRFDFDNRPTTLCRAGDPTTCGGTQYGNVDWALGMSLAAVARITENLSVSVQYGLRTAWKYQVASSTDPGNAQAVTSAGISVQCSGYCRGDSVNTSIGINYQLSDHWGVQLYTHTTMPPLNSLGTAPRFPFWDLESGPLNRSQLGTSLAASF